MLQCFNSNMVRLKLKIESELLDKVVFQFQYGTIKATESLIFFEITGKFQFQYGTIKAIPVGWALTSYDSFQFQYGTIKAKFPNSLRAIG